MAQISAFQNLQDKKRAHPIPKETKELHKAWLHTVWLLEWMLPGNTWKIVMNKQLEKHQKGLKIRIEATFTMFIFTPCILVWVE